MGTTLGSGTVFFLKNQIKDSFQKLLLGFASGVMIAASVWSLIIPAIDSSEAMGKFAFLPAAIGIALGMAFLFLLDIFDDDFRRGVGVKELKWGKSPPRLHFVATYPLA